MYHQKYEIVRLDTNEEGVVIEVFMAENNTERVKVSIQGRVVEVPAWSAKKI